MENVNLMEQKEKIFFAGCLKSLLLSDGMIENTDINDLFNLTEKLQFNAFETYLESYEDMVKTTETFWEMAENITNNDVQDIIITSLHDMQLKEHIPDYQRGKLVGKLEYLWS